MPELPEVETARCAIEGAALGRRIVEVDDTDSYVCRPHHPGEIRAALLGRELSGAFRRGKTLWCETTGAGDREESSSGPVLGMHLGMAGRLLISRPEQDDVEGGDYLGGRYPTVAEQPSPKPEWDRFTLTFADGGVLRLFDKRRLGRVRLDPALEALGPDAAEVGLAEFRKRLAGSAAPVKARLLDQSVVAGVGNLLADEVLWQARVDPRRPVADLGPDEVTRLHRAMRTAVRTAMRRGGVHTLDVVEARSRDGHCPRCGTAMARGTVGTRTTYWCPVGQA